MKNRTTRHKWAAMSTAAICTAAAVCFCSIEGERAGAVDPVPSYSVLKAEKPETPSYSVLKAEKAKTYDIRRVEIMRDKPAQPPKLEVKAYYDVPLDYALQDHIIATCEDYGIDPAIVVAMIERESKYNAAAIGDNGRSFGLMQIQKKWHKERLERLECSDLLDAEQNITVGVDFLAELLERYSGDMEKALVAYNQGSYNGTVTSYAKTIINNTENLRKGMKNVIYRHSDPLADFNAYDSDMQRLLEELPVCEYCGEEIQDDYYYDINGESVCPSCLEQYFKRDNTAHED